MRLLESILNPTSMAGITNPAKWCCFQNPRRKRHASFFRVHASQMQSRFVSSVPERQFTGELKQVQLVQFPVRLSEDSARDITFKIKSCLTVQQLHAVCQRHGKSFNHIHVSAAVTHIAQMHTQGSPWTSRATSAPAAFPVHRSSSRLASNPASSDMLPSTSYSHTARSSSAPQPPGSAGHSNQPAARGGADTPPSSSHPATTRTSDLPVEAAQLMDKLLYISAGHMGRCGTRQLANMIWSVAKCGHTPHPTWLQKVMSAASRLWGQFEAQHVSNMAYALARLNYDPGRAWLQSLMQESIRTLPTSKPQEISNLIYALSSMSERQRVGDQWLALMVQQSRSCMTEFNGQELANMAWAMAKLIRLSGHSPTLVTQPASLAQCTLSTQPTSLAGTAAGATNAPSSSGSSLDADDAADVSSRCEASDSSSPLLAAADGSDALPVVASPWTRVSEPAQSSGRGGSSGGDCWLSALLLAAKQRMHASNMSPQGLSNILLACAKLRYRPADSLLREVCYYSKRDLGLGVFGPQALSNQLLAFAHLGFLPPEDYMLAFEAAAGSCLLRRRAGGAAEAVLPQHLANTVWAMARLGWTPQRGFTELLLMRTMQRLPDMKPAEVAQVMGALAKLRLKPNKFCLDLACIQVHQMADSAPSCGKEATAILTALTCLGHRPCDAWLHWLSALLLPQLHELSGRSLAMLIHSFARLKHRPSGGWVQVFSTALLERSAELNAADAASLLWAVAVLELELRGELSEVLVTTLLVRMPADSQGVSGSDRRLHASKAAWALGCLYPEPHRPESVTTALLLLSQAEGVDDDE